MTATCPKCDCQFDTLTFAGYNLSVVLVTDDETLEVRRFGRLISESDDTAIYQYNGRIYMLPRE